MESADSARSEALGAGVLAGLAACAVRVPLLFGSEHAPGFDGWYYVLQTESLLDSGQLVFPESGWVFWLLAALAAVVGDAVISNKIAALGFATVTVGAGTAGAHSLLRSVPGALASGLWWGLCHAHLTVSVEYLKNSAGLAVFALLFAVVAAHRPSRSVAVPVAVLLLAAVTAHKLMGGLSAMLVASWVAESGLKKQAWAWAAVVLVCAGVAAWTTGALGMEDLAHFSKVSLEGGARWLAMARTPTEAADWGVAHLAPVVLAIGAYQARSGRGVWLGVLGLSVVGLAPGLPFGYDALSWRLLLVSFFPAGLAVGGVVKAAGRYTLPALGVVMLYRLLSAPNAVDTHRARMPNYEEFEVILERLEHLPSGQRVVAHRGLCGFLWARGGLHCENFDPEDADGWKRVVFGFGEHRLGAYGEVVELRPGYVLVDEHAWRRFRHDHAGQYSLLEDARNPFRPRPAHVRAPSP